MAKFRVGLTRDFLTPEGELSYGSIGLDLLNSVSHLEWEFLLENRPELLPSQVRDYDALIVLSPRISATTLTEADRLILIARFGVGYDNIDIEACTQRGVMVTITPEGVRRPVAVSVLGFILALSLRMFEKDRLLRTGRWQDRLHYMGIGLTGKTLGVIGLGNIGKEIFRLVKPLEMRHIAYDPYVQTVDADLNVDLVDLETLLRTADFISVNCPLTPETYHLINASRISLMKPSAFIINTARGGIIDQKALTEALQQRRIQGAALDVFESEPIDPQDPLIGLDNVILTPHSICWTDECFYGNGVSACQSVIDIACGKIPKYVVNKDVLNSPNFLKKLDRIVKLFETTSEGRNGNSINK